MKISEMIECLEKIKIEHGDLDVETTGWDLTRLVASPPKVDYRAILKGRESKPRFISYFRDDRENRAGEKVCRI